MGKKAVSKLFHYITVAITTALAIVTLLGNFVSEVSPTRSIVFPFIGLALPVLLLINLVVAIYWTSRWRCWLFIPLIAIIGNWTYLNQVFQFRSVPKVILSSEIITLATYNVGAFNHEQSGYTCRNVADYMKSERADILCFQEFGIHKTFNVDSVKAVFSDWPYCFIPQSPDSLQLLKLALFSKFPIKESQLITYPNSKNCSLWCDLDLNGTTLRVFNNHLQTTEVSQNRRRLDREMKKDDATANTEVAATKLLDGLHQNFVKRASQSEKLGSLINATPHPMLVCGDFNSLPASYTYHTVKGNKLTDGFLSSGHGYMYTFRYFKHLLRIDYVFHTSNIQGVDYYATELPYSDHNPVVMRVKLKHHS